MRTKRSFNETKREELVLLGRDVRRRAVGHLAELPIASDPYRATSDLLDAANRLLELLDAENWRGRNSIGRR
ncbi:hypothetical protein IHQ68_03390 [Chelatococcus sambhunathii]|uniref:Uncharacterized protein n=1 Tax=Chelatococcus sambhunathii TaxID=363953 RepID=A0ABU1DC28_9HYPH|nr:hypothetical protein [Chelatococcus sambhunathii]MDR4305666.1 hypothetical protein [Chelatococcus sambhunathii]